MEKAIEKSIGQIIHKNIPIEWMRYNMFSVDNIYKNIPILVFRYGKECSDESKQKLMNAVLTFEGREKWSIFRHPSTRKDNYILSIALMESIMKRAFNSKGSCSPDEILGLDVYKKCCENAVSDIPQLAEHISSFLL